MHPPAESRKDLHGNWVTAFAVDKERKREGKRECEHERERDRIRLGVVEPNAEKQKSRNKKIILFFGLSSSLLRPFGSLGLK